MLEFENQFGKIIASTKGGQVLSWQVKDGAEMLTEILYQGSEQKRTGIPILFPFADPLESNVFNPSGLEIPQHGFARNSNWREGWIENGLKLCLSCQDLDDRWKKSYPYDFDTCIEIKILENRLVFSLIVVNRGDLPLPIAPGIHPYFPVSHDQKKSIQTSLSDFDFTTTDWDNFSKAEFTDFTANKFQFQFPDYRLTITETSPRKTVDHLVIWSQGQGHKDLDFICLEPFTRETNAINTNPILVDKTWQMEVTFEVNML
jgi:galactose mutarotase-like enzyme